MDHAKTLAGKLDVDLDAEGVCHACLSFVSMALDDGDAKQIAREVRRLTPDLWGDGLGLHVLEALRAAAARQVQGAAAALVDAEQRGGRSPIARAVVLRLAAELSDRTHRHVALLAAARDRLSDTPELN